MVINWVIFFSLIFTLFSSIASAEESTKCDKNILSLCEGNYKSNDYVRFCTDISKLYLIDSCNKKNEEIRNNIRVIFEACEDDYGNYCVKSTDKKPKFGVACIKEYKKRVSFSCRQEIKELFEYVD